MSTLGISTAAEVRIQESDSVKLNDTLAWLVVCPADDSIAERSEDACEESLCYETAFETELVSAAKSGDQQAFAELCRRYTPLLKRRIRGIIRNREDSEDVLQDTLLSAYKNLAAFQAKSSFRTWITTIAINNAFMLLRKRRNHPETGLMHVTPEGTETGFLEVLDPLPNPEEICVKRQLSRRMAQAVRRLPPGFRKVVERYHQDEMRLVDAANAVGITVAAAKSRLMRARNALRRHLANGGAVN
jgi:RNA polymerase sigma-70 factor (ECF subfamily)